MTGFHKMDNTDRKILALMQQDASLSVAEIGSQVGLSSTPCWKRIQRLEADGVIQRRVALVDQDKLGLAVTVFVSIETGDHSQGWLDRFAEVVGAMPEVMEFDRMAGAVGSETVAPTVCLVPLRVQLQTILGTEFASIDTSETVTFSCVES